MAFAQTLFDALATARQPTLELVARFDVPSIVRPWFVMLYQVIRATSPLLCRASFLSEKLGEAALGDFFGGKLDEERGHDELLLKDLRRLDVSRTHAEKAPTHPAIADMVGRQYYLMDFEHPSAFLGYIALLEGFPPTLAQVEALATASGVPDAWKTARLHAGADIEHRKALAACLDDDVEPAWRPAILTNGLRCVQHQRQALETLLNGD